MNKSIAIMQPYLFPYLGYFQLIYHVNDFILYDKVDFIKNGWINRNRLLSNDKRNFLFKVPLRKSTASSFNTIDNVLIDNSQQWRKKFIKQILHNYKKSRYFEEIIEQVHDAILYDTENISEYNIHCLNIICEILKIKKPIILNIEEMQIIENSVRKLNNRKYERIKLISQLMGSEYYVNPEGGQIFYDKEIFDSMDITYKTLTMNLKRDYPIDKELGFNVSILDVLFKHGLVKTRELLREYTII